MNVEEFKSSEKMPLVVVLDDVRSMYNVGSVFRTSDAFRVEAIYLCGITAQPPHPEIHKTALGAEDTVEWRYFKDTMEAVNELKARGYFVYSIEQCEGSTKLQNLSPLPPEGGRHSQWESSDRRSQSNKTGHVSPPPSGDGGLRRVLISDFSSRLFEHLKLSEKGFTPYHDKSSAEEIYAMFGVSKKVFKQAVGDLLKRELIQIKPDGIELTIKGKATGVEE